MITGNTRYRISLFRKMIFQVEESYVDYYEGKLIPGVPPKPVMALRWRDATYHDITTLGWLADKVAGKNPPPPDQP
jgi:hypothetical protein